VTIGQQKVAEEQQAKFRDEDVEDSVTEKKSTTSSASSSTQKPKTKKEPLKYTKLGAVDVIEEPLDDPIAEKLRQAK